MKLPSKTTPYKRSVLSLFPMILYQLKNDNMRVSDLHKSLPQIPLGDFISALDCLYALSMIDFNKKKELIFYAGADSMQ